MPIVSIIIPCYNEQATIRALLDALLLQSYPRSEMEIILADGMSSDQTRTEISAFQNQHADLQVRIIDNPRRNISAALNCALEAAKGEFIVRLDAHSVPMNDYVERSIADLQAELGTNVGGVWQIEPGAKGWLAASIAAAAAHPLGVGDALYRIGSAAREVDTVPFGAFRRDLIEHIGKFDENLLTNEDYEFNARIRKQGGIVWLDPSIRCIYYTRRTLPDLARQYARYGFWKRRMLARYAQTLRWRQALPPLFVLALLVLLLLIPFWNLARLALILQVLAYSGILFLGGMLTAIKKKTLLFVVGVPLAIATMHLSWGAGFLWSMLKPISKD